MTDFLTKLALVGAAVSFALWLYLVNRRRIARVPEFVSHIPRSSLSVFLAAAFVATLCAQKPDGTNAPPNGASPPQMVPPGGGNVELKIEDFRGVLSNGNLVDYTTVRPDKCPDRTARRERPSSAGLRR